MNHRTLRIKKACMLIILMMHVPLIFAQNIDNFFQSTTNYTAYPLLRGLKIRKGEIKNFSYGLWGFYNAFRFPPTKSFFANIPSDWVLTSNNFGFKMSKQDESAYNIEGAEIQLNRKLPITDLGYQLVTSDSSITSEYYIVAFAVNAQAGTHIKKVSARLFSYLNEAYEIEGEIVGLRNTYFIYGYYRYLNRRSRTLSKSSQPSLIVLERTDQQVLAVINILGKRAVWEANGLTSDEQAAVAFTCGVFNLIRFQIADSGYLAKKRRALNKSDEEEPFLTNRDAILTPEQLSEEFEF